MTFVYWRILSRISSLLWRHHLSITPIAEVNLEVDSWTRICKAITAGSSLDFEDNVYKDQLSFQLTYKINIGCPYYKASIAPNQKLLNDLEPSKEKLEKFMGELWKKWTSCGCKLIVEIPFLPLIIKEKPSILILPKFKPKIWFFGLLMILN